MPKLRARRLSDQEAIVTYLEDDEPPVFGEANHNSQTQAGLGDCTNCNVNIENSQMDSGTSEETNSHESVHSSIGLLSQKYESLDYDVCENTLYLEEQKKLGTSTLFQRNVIRWFVIFLIAVLTAFTACAIVILIDLISGAKFRFLKKWMNNCYNNHCLYYPMGIWFLSNAFPVLIGSLLVVFVSPVAAGSGIPLIKCYLNGVKVPEVVRVKTFITKAIGVITSVAGGLACGKEGPMIHCGAVIAAGVSQGKSTTLKHDFNIFQSFREDKEKRDFVSAGAAAGVAAAFGAPVGGVLFSLEEGASFWNQSLTWKIFFCSMSSSFVLNVIMSWYHGKPGELSYAGLLNFGKFDDINYSFVELPIYLLMGAAGGLFGALFNFVNHKLTVFRMKFLNVKWIKVAEAVLVALATAAVGFLMILLSGDCRENKLIQDPSKASVQFHCPDGKHSVMAELWFDTPEATVRSLFHSEPDTWSAVTLSFFFFIYLMIACWTYGLSISGGVFIPCLLTGAAGGRLVAIGALHLFPGSSWVIPGKFALIGAAAMLGGVVRMTISLTVILIEATGNITLGIPIMCSLMIAKWVGDYFTEGLYDIHIHLNCVPLLAWEPPTLNRNVYASEIMSSPVVTFNLNENVGTIIDVLKKETHNGFPVVEEADMMRESFYDSLPSNRSPGRFRGFILRWQLIVLLQKKMFNETAEDFPKSISLADFRNVYPRYPPIESVNITDEERDYTIDLRPYMNPSPYSVSHTASLPRIFRLFRALGLRHLVVVNDRNGVIGIVTRKDLARYRTVYNKGMMSLREMHISHDM